MHHPKKAKQESNEQLWSQIADFQAANASQMDFHDSAHREENHFLDDFSPTAMEEPMLEHTVLPRNAHVHELKGPSRAVRCRHCSHIHRFSGITGGAIPLPNGGHVHGIHGITEQAEKK